MSLKQALVLLAVAAYLTARTFVAPGVPVLLGGDQGFFWMYALRMLHGEHVYRDFFQFTPPGTDIVYLFAFALLGARVWVANAVVVLLGTLLGGVCLSVARRIMHDGPAALVTAIFTVMVFGQALNGTHHWWSVLAVMGAVAVLSPGSTPRRFAVGGALLGIASFFTQTHGIAALVACVVFAALEGRRDGLARGAVVARMGSLVGGFVVTLLSAFAYFIATVGLGPILSCVVVYVWRYLSYAPPSLGLPEPLTWTSVRWLAPYLVVYAMVPVGYGLTAALALSGRDRRVTLLWLVGMAMLVDISANFNWVRLFGVCMPALILCIRTIAAPTGRARSLRVAATCALAAFASLFLRSTYRHHPVVVALPGGVVATDAFNEEKLPWLAEHAPAGSAFFAANRLTVYLPLGVQSPIYLDGAVPGRQTTAALIGRTIDEVERSRVPYILWSPLLGEAGPGEEPDAIVALRTHMHDHYRLARRFADGDEAWERR
jgi:hypothetical protein